MINQIGDEYIEDEYDAEEEEDEEEDEGDDGMSDESEDVIGGPRIRVRQGEQEAAFDIINLPN